MRPLHFLTTPWYFLSLHKTMSREDVVVKDEKRLELGKGSNWPETPPVTHHVQVGSKQGRAAHSDG